MSTATFLERARSALDTPTLYWLGKGGWTRSEPASLGPGRPIDLPRELAQLQAQRPAVHAAYLSALQGAGLAMAELPTLACDCSGFLCWALGVARDGAPWTGGWISTDLICADAVGARHLFRPAERAAPGTLLVYPKPRGHGTDGPPGHVGIVTAATPDGRPARVLHCAPGNLLRPPPAGHPRNAIAETDTAPFLEVDPAPRLVAWRGFDGAS
jgi:hypothetical protein